MFQLKRPAMVAFGDLVALCGGPAAVVSHNDRAPIVDAQRVEKARQHKPDFPVLGHHPDAKQHLMPSIVKDVSVDPSVGALHQRDCGVAGSVISGFDIAVSFQWGGPAWAKVY